VLAGYDPSASWAERIRTSLTGLLSFGDVKRGAGRLLMVGSLGAGASAFERRERVLAQMIAFVDEGRTEVGVDCVRRECRILAETPLIAKT
jgi:hypothetical protein